MQSKLVFIETHKSQKKAFLGLGDIEGTVSLSGIRIWSRSVFLPAFFLSTMIARWTKNE